MPVRFTQFKSDVHGGILGSGGCVSVIEFRHLSILEVGCEWWKTYLLTIRHPNHRIYDFAFCSNANSRAGVTGYSVMRTPNGESALSMAETMAAAAGTQPDSPTPFTPSGLSGEGNCTKLTSTFGTSVAL